MIKQTLSIFIMKIMVKRLISKDICFYFSYV